VASDLHALAAPEEMAPAQQRTAERPRPWNRRAKVVVVMVFSLLVDRPLRAAITY